jgi:Peptidase A4 family
MRLRTAVFVAAAFALALIGSSPAAARTNGPRLAPNHKITHSTSSNWAGYAAFNGRYTTVSASWRQPTASCTSATTYSSFWVGLDGYSSNTVEQTGSSADCSGGTPRYYAWYEMYPKFPVNLSIAVRAGDSMSASVTTDGSGHFTLHIHNGTTGGDFVTSQTSKKARLSSAEAIAEAPSGSGGVLPLTNFGTASFSAVTVNGQAIGSFNPDKIDMVGNGFTKASTSALSGGNAFSVAWKHS